MLRMLILKKQKNNNKNITIFFQILAKRLGQQLTFLHRNPANATDASAANADAEATALNADDNDTNANANVLMQRMLMLMLMLRMLILKKTKNNKNITIFFQILAKRLGQQLVFLYRNPDYLDACVLRGWPTSRPQSGKTLVARQPRGHRSGRTLVARQGARRRSGKTLSNFCCKRYFLGSRAVAHQALGQRLA